MIGVTSPAVLAGLAGIAVPIAIHLWSHRPSRVIRVGSVKLLAQSRPARARRVALSDIPRLVLRVALVALAALAAAGLAWYATPSAGTTVVLVDPSLRHDARVGPMTDSLLATGATAHWLSPGLPPLRAAAAPVAGSSDTWRLLAEADARFPGATLIVAAPRDAKNYVGSRPALLDSVRWMAGGTPSPVATPPDSATLSVLLIAARGHEREARTLAAAMGAIADTRPIRITIDRATSPDSLSVSRSTVVIALGVTLDAGRMGGMLRRGALLLADSVAWPRPSPGEVARWRGSDGRPLLTMAPLGGARLARLATIFSPRTLPLLASADFADSLAALVLPSAPSASGQPLTDGQRTPGRSPAVAAAAVPTADLAWMAALLALVGFSIERAWAARPRAR